MKMLILLLLLSPAFISSTKSIGGATPYIQSVCKVTLEDDSIIEGFFDMGGGGMFYYYRTNGIYLNSKNDARDQLLEFNLEFRKFNRTNVKGEFELLYAKNISAISDEIGSQPMIFVEGKNLIKEKHERQIYELHKSIILYEELPSHMLLSFKKEGNESEIKIDLNKVKEIKFYKTPPEKWLKKIRDAEKNDIKQNSGEDWEYIYLEWYHDIIMNKERKNYLMRYF